MEAVVCMYGTKTSHLDNAVLCYVEIRITLHQLAELINEQTIYYRQCVQYKTPTPHHKDTMIQYDRIKDESRR